MNWRKIKWYLLLLFVFFISCKEKKHSDNLVLIKGGYFKNSHSNFFGTKVWVEDFYIGRFEVTQKEWIEVMGYNPSKFQGDNLPVENVNWYECIVYCNRRSVKEGLTPYYYIDSTHKDSRITNEFDTIRWIVSINPYANGYRLPTVMEWEYAAGGGQKSKNYEYAGSNDINEVCWYWRNAGKKFLEGMWAWIDIEKNLSQTQPVGQKRANELGLYDMSGNVREWCWDMYEPTSPEDMQGRTWKGGGWIGGEHCCVISFTGSFEASGKGPDQGFRVCKNKE